MSDELPDRLPLADAARIAERHPETLRRWMRDGVLTRYEGPTPIHGGSAPVMVARDELLAHLAISGQQPRPESPSKDVEGGGMPPSTEQVHTPQPPPLHAEIEALHRRLVEAEHREQLATLRGQLAVAKAEGEIAALRTEVEALRARLTSADHARIDMQRDRDDWKERHDAREAELLALRAIRGPWWRRLLGSSEAK